MEDNIIYLPSNIKHLRTQKNITQKQIADFCNKTDVAISYWENGSREPNAIDLSRLSSLFNVSVNDLLLKDLRFDNAETITETIKIAVYGSIKAGIPLESQNDIVEYMDIPKTWGIGKKIFGLRISGDSMYPKYNDGDTVIFEQTNDIETYKNKDCAVMINNTESTFKKLLVNEQGIMLQPYNASYDIMMFSKEQIEKLPIVVLGVARKKVSDVE